MHWHVCEDCKVLWRHSENCADQTDAHICPKCNEEHWERFTTKKEAQKALNPDWHHTDDPHEIIPVGWKTSEYKVIAYYSLAGVAPKMLRVKVEFFDKNHILLSYLEVLCAYFRSVEAEKLFHWRV